MADSVAAAYALLNGIRNFAINESKLSLEDFDGLFEKSKTLLLNPNPFVFTPKSAVNRQAINANTVENVTLSEDAKSNVLALSDFFDFDELECLKYWQLVNIREQRHWLEERLGYTKDTLAGNLFEACKQSIIFERKCRLDSLLHLIRSRNDTNLNPAARRRIIAACNGLLKDGLVNNIIVAIRAGIDRLKRSSDSSSATTAASFLQPLTECLFFGFYSTQIEVAEARAILDLIRDVSGALAEVSSSGAIEGWKTMGYSVLAVLQMTYTCALDQIVELQNREVDDAPDLPGAPAVFADQNAIKPAVGDRSGLDADWRCKGAKGFACLANAVLRQPLVDSNDLSSREVVLFLLEAANLRAYSYIRLCLLPVLRTFYLKDEENFYICVLCELLKKIAHIFQIYELALHPDRHRYLSTHNLSAIRAIDSSTTTKAPPIEQDCLDDVMHLFATICSIRPSFAEIFRENEEGGGSSMHPFVINSAAACTKEPYLLLPMMRLLAGVGCGPQGNTAAATYHYIRSSEQHHLRWEHFFRCIERIASSMGQTVVQPVIGAAGNMSAVYMPSPPGVVGGDVAGTGAAPSRKPLGPRDEEALIAMMDLIAVCARDRDSAQSLYAEYDPVKKLFALIACPISILLKGATFRALASLARGCPTAAEEVWALIEAYRLLPAKGTGVASASGRSATAGGGASASGSGSMSSQHGLRFELEATESSTGVYPVTEGFLELLDALIHTYGPPDDLGYGYRRPGIMVYLEFVIDDVLQRAHERYYAPESRRGTSQRWRLTARALKVLVSVLQHYSINRLPENIPLEALPETVSGDPKLIDVAADFKEIIESYTIDGGSQQSTAARPKTAGFVVMSLLLNSGKLIEQVLALLGNELLPPQLEETRAVQGFDAASCAVEILSTMQSPIDHPQGGGGIHFHADKVPVEIDLSSIGFEEGIATCDEAFWREKTVSNCVALLYECSLRESRFLSLVRTAPSLTIMRSDDGRITAIPVIVQGGGITEILCTRLALANIASLLLTPLSYCHSLPPVPVMAARLLQHAANTQSAEKFLWSLKYAPEQEQYLLSGCAQALVDGDETQLNLVFKEIVALGADREPDVFTQSAEASVHPPLHGSSLSELLNAAYLGALDCEDTVRGSILLLLLKTLTPDRPCFAHQLLGLREAIEKGARAGQSDAVGYSLPKMPKEGEKHLNCLQSILSLMSPGNASVNLAGTNFNPAAFPSSSLIQRNPEVALMCFELVYRLCSASITSTIVLTYLRSRSIDFLRKQLQEVLFLCSLPDSILCPDPARLETVKVARHHCTAWLLQIYALELRALELAPNTSPSQIKETLALLFEATAGGSRASGGGVTVSASLSSSIPVCVLQKSAFDLPILSLPAVSSPTIIRSLTAATVPHTVSKGGNGWGRNSADGASCFTTVDVTIFIRLVQDERARLSSVGRAAAIEDADVHGGVEAAVKMNVYNMRAAAATHLCQAWGQAVDVAVLGCHGILLDRGAGGRAASLRRLITTVVIPLLQALATSQSLEMVMAEQLIRPILSLVSEAGHRPLLTPDEHQQLLQSLLQCLLRKSAGFSENPRSVTSFFFRGFVSSCVTRVLHIALAAASINQTQGGGSSAAGSSSNGSSLTPSEEDKQSERDVRGALLLTTVGAASPEECRARDLAVLERCVVELVDLLGSDATNGPVVWRVNALASLSAVVTTMSPSRSYDNNSDRGGSLQPSLTTSERLKFFSSHRDNHASPALIKALQTLSQRGNLSTILSYVGPSTPFPGAVSAADAQLNLNEPGGEELFESAMSLCVAIGTTREGAAALLEGGFLQRVCGLQLFRNPPPASEEVLPFGQDGIAVREEALRLFDAQLTPTLRALRCLAAVSPSAVVLEGCAEFLRLNHASFTYVLRLRIPTLHGLELIESTLALTAAVAAAPPIAASSVPRQKLARVSVLQSANGAAGGPAVGGADVRTTIWDSVLGEVGDSLTSDVSSLLRILGGDPLPTHITTRYGGAGASAGAGASWWTHIKPSSSGEEIMQQTPCGEAAALSMPAGWSLFEHKKLLLSLKVTSSAASFLRIRSAACVELGIGGGSRVAASLLDSNIAAFNSHSMGGMLTIDFDSIAIVFEKCANIYRQRAATRGSNISVSRDRRENNNQHASLSWLTSPLAVGEVVVTDLATRDRLVATADAEAKSILPAFSYILENLICILHDLNTSASAAEAATWSQTLDRCASLAEEFPPHSFIRQVARWIRDKLSNQ